MRKMLLVVIVVACMFVSWLTPQAKAEPGANSLISMQNTGWSQTCSGQGYFCTPQYVNNWALEIWTGVWWAGHYHFDLAVTISKDQSWSFYDHRDLSHNSGPADKVLMLFKTFGAPMDFPPNSPNPQGFFEGDAYDTVYGWTSWIECPPGGSTWSAWVASYNFWRPDEISCGFIDCGNGRYQSDLPNLINYEMAWGQ